MTGEEGTLESILVNLNIEFCYLKRISILTYYNSYEYLLTCYKIDKYTNGKGNGFY